MEKGILTLEQEKQLAQMLDDALKLKGFPGLVDGPLAKIILTYLDDTVFDKVQVELKVKLSTLIDAVMAKDVKLSETIASEIITGLVTIKGLDKESELLIVRGVIELIVGIVLSKLSTVKSEVVTSK